MTPCTDAARAHGCCCREREGAPGYEIDPACPVHGAIPFLLPDTTSAQDQSREISVPMNLGVIVDASSAAFDMYGERPPTAETEAFRQALLSESIARAGQISPIATLFPADVTTRKTPPLFVGGDDAWRAHNNAAYRDYFIEHLPPSVLSMLRDVTVQDAAIYFDGGDTCTILYEMHRPNDRPTKPGDADIHLRARTYYPKQANEAYLLIASAGSHNWGHWLTDDLPRVAAAVFLRRHVPKTKVTIILLSFGLGIDEARRRSIECHPDLGGVSVLFLRRAVAYHFEELFYASPVSYHPTAKLKGAVDYVRQSYVREEASSRRKLYLSRPEGDVRNLANADEVEAFMREEGFEVVDCAALSFDAQLALFKEASIVVGIMGAAMANTIFSRRGIRVVHLVCIGWIEPYYWDLADACGQRCCYVFGPTTEPEKPAHFARFTISPDDLAVAVAKAQV